MKKFSSEPKERKEKRKAIVKTILKRYSFIVWLPILIFVLNKIGSTNVIFGSLIVSMVVLIGIVIIDILEVSVYYFTEMDLGEFFKEKLLIIYKRIKSEPQRFKDAVQKELDKNTKQWKIQKNTLEI